MTPNTVNDLYFLGMDIPEETKTMVSITTVTCTDGMTESELKAYKMGIENTISVLKSILENDGIAVIHIDGIEVPTEFSIDELERYYPGF